jgi:4-amino-4-deoxy-L-arabinose transferase-like glycosyltransferase
LLILGAFVIFYRLGDRDMWTGSESEASVAAWDIAETGRYLVPHILERPIVDNRPPGAWWPIAILYKLTGIRNTWTARLPSALAALICILLAYAMGRRTMNPSAGFLSALILMGMLFFVIIGRQSQQDMLLTTVTTACLWAFWRPYQGTGYLHQHFQLHSSLCRILAVLARCKMDQLYCHFAGQSWFVAVVVCLCMVCLALAAY